MFVVDKDGKDHETSRIRLDAGLEHQKGSFTAHLMRTMQLASQSDIDFDVPRFKVGLFLIGGRPAARKEPPEQRRFFSSAGRGEENAARGGRIPQERLDVPEPNLDVIFAWLFLTLQRLDGTRVWGTGKGEPCDVASATTN